MSGKTTFEGFKVVHLLGKGGMGEVYLAEDLNSPNHKVALKRIASPVLEEENAKIEFRKEVDILIELARFNPNVIAVYEVHLDHDPPFFTMEYCQNGSLADELQRRRASASGLSPRQAAEWVRRLAEAMHVVHQKEIVHRDLKPSNVLVGGVPAGDTEPLLKISDFGLARPMQRPPRPNNAPLPTSIGIVKGTPEYMAPEQASSVVVKIDARADVYSLGVILFELLAGRTPFQGATNLQVLGQVLRNPPPRLRALNRRVPRNLEWVCFKCLEKKTTNRYKSAKDLAVDLQRHLNGEVAEACPYRLLEPALRSRMWVNRNPWLSAAMTLLILLTTGGILGTLYVNYLRGREAEALIKTHDALEESELLNAQLNAQRIGISVQMLERFESDLTMSAEGSIVGQSKKTVSAHKNLELIRLQVPFKQSATQGLAGVVPRALDYWSQTQHGNFDDGKKSFEVVSAAIQQERNGPPCRIDRLVSPLVRRLALDHLESMSSLYWFQQLARLGHFDEAITIARRCTAIVNCESPGKDVQVSAIKESLKGMRYLLCLEMASTFRPIRNAKRRELEADLVRLYEQATEGLTPGDKITCLDLCFTECFSTTTGHDFLADVRRDPLASCVAKLWLQLIESTAAKEYLRACAKSPQAA